jgi:hypothetical protein
LLTNPSFAKAIRNTICKRKILVKRLDRNAPYYLVPFDKISRRLRLQSSAVAIFDAQNAAFKEASWTEKPQQFLGLERAKAISLVGNYVLKNRSRYFKRYIRSLFDFLRYFNNAKAELVWKPNSLSPSPYRPWWKVTFAGSLFSVTQEGKVIAAN